MSDPAIEAAQRAWGEQFPLGPSWGAIPGGSEQFFTSAAREMAKPIRELHDHWNAVGVLPPEAWQILDQLARLIFTTGELER